MSSEPRLSRQTVSVLELLMAQPNDWHYGYDISRDTGLKSGTLYPILMRLAANSWLETRWEEGEPGRPARHMYRLTSNGKHETRRFLEKASARGFLPVPEGSKA
jgi:PadR family transcriptional regulator PadR